MWHKIYLVLMLVTICSLNLVAGTLIYKNLEGETRTISKVTLLSVDKNKIIVKVNNGTQVLGTNRVIKYFNSNLSSGEFDDSSADYTVRIGTADCPESGYGNGKNKKKVSSFKVNYNIAPENDGKQRKYVRYPYFFLALLVGNGSGGREILWFSYPKQAKSSFKNYDEIKMFEQVISSERPHYYPNDNNRLLTGSSSKKMGGEREATFELRGVKNRKIIAWHLIVWGKNEIKLSEGKTVLFGSDVSKNWWIR